MSGRIFCRKGMGNGTEEREQVSALYQRVLDSERCTSPGAVVSVGDGQQVEVCHIFADAVQTLVFYLVHGGPAIDEPHYGPSVSPLDPPELAHGGWSGTRWP